MKVIAYCALHYGKEYLYYAIKSVIDHVDEFHVLYSSVGSHGAQALIPCPDSRDELYAQASAAAGDKLRWHDGTWAHEGFQRESIHLYAPDADVILVVDADEIWPLDLAPDIIDCYTRFSPSDAISTFRVPIIHYWRSFYKAVLHDPAYPTRAIFPKWSSHKEATFHNGPINHMGYAQRPEVTHYKQYTHGHRGEWRWQEDWFNNIFMTNRQTDCHPVGSQYWDPETVNPLDYMPAFMADHPYFNLPVIGEVRNEPT